MELRGLLLWSGVFVTSTALVKAAYMGLVLVLAKVLSQEAYASFGLLYAAQTAMGTFGVVGVQETTIGRLRGRRSELRRRALFRDGVGLSYATAAIALAVMVLFVTLAESNSRATALGMTAALLVGGMTAFATLQASFMRLEERHAGSLAFSAGVPLLSCVGSAGAAFWVGSVEAVFVGGFVGSALGLCMLLGLRHGFLSRVLPWARVKPALWSLLPFAVIGVFGWLSGYGNTFVINAIFDSAEVAQYTFLFTVASISSLAATAMNMFWSPRFYRVFLEGSFDQAEAQSHWFFTVQALALGCLGGACVAALPWVVRDIGGHLGIYGTMQLPLALLFSGYVLAIPWWHAQNYYVVSGQGSKLVRNVIWTGTVGLIAWVTCMLLLGEIGIYWGFLVQTAIKSMGAWGAARTHWPLSPPWLGILAGATLTVVGLVLPVPDEMQ